MQIDLNNYRTPGTFAYSGKDRGTEIRKKLGLDSVDKNEQEIEILVPTDVFSLNTSFFLGLLGQSVRSLGEKRFEKKYHFKASDIILDSIRQGIHEALKDSLPIPRVH